MKLNRSVYKLRIKCDDLIKEKLIKRIGLFKLTVAGVARGSNNEPGRRNPAWKRNLLKHATRWAERQNVFILKIKLNTERKRRKAKVNFLTAGAAFINKKTDEAIPYTIPIGILGGRLVGFLIDECRR